MNHIRAVLCVSNRIFRNVSFYVAKLQVIACVQHTAICVSTSLTEIILCLLCCCDKHFRSVEMLCKKCLGDLRTKVSKVYTKSVAACFFDVFKSLNHMNLALYNTDWTFINILCVIFLCVGLNKSFSSVYRKAFRETVSADCNDSNFYFWHVIHDFFLHFFCYLLVYSCFYTTAYKFYKYLFIIFFL